jgi:MFS family permease
MYKPISLRALWARLTQNLYYLTAGGAWTMQLPVAVQRNLRWYFSDGVLATASDSIVITYISLFLLALGATRAQIGLLSSLSSMVAMLLLIPGAILAERWGKRKLLVLLSGGGVTRISYLLMALLPFFMGIGPGAVFAVIALKVVADGFANMGVPAWTAITADVVPISSRGRYFGTRNLVMNIAGMVTIYLMGFLITRMPELQGYQLATGIAFIIGAGATFSFAQIKESSNTPVPSASLANYTPAAILRLFREDKNFLVYCLYAGLWNTSIMVAGPFFTPFQVEVLKSNAEIIGVQSVITSLVGLPSLRIFGRLADRWGARKVMLLNGFLIPILPVMWIFMRGPWDVVPVNIGTGIFWSGYGLASFNFLLEIVPPVQRERYTAIYQVIIMLGTTLGAALGGLIASLWGYQPLFIISGVGRMLATLVFWRLVKSPAATPAASMEVQPG